MAKLNFDKIKGVIYTEKSSKLLEQNKYCFRVEKDCKKDELAKVIADFFKVEVVAVNIVTVKGKTKRFRGFIGTRPSYKKAIISVKEGQSINFESL